MAESIGEHDIRRIQWRCRRGMLELDLLLQRFMEQGYALLGDREQRDFVELLELPDNVLLDYLHSRAEPDNQKIKNIIKKIL